jgi:hypothetical protein
VYDMYPWDKAAARRADDTETGRRARPGRAGSDPKTVDAVQVALDRRDNGGDAASRARQ